MEGLGVCEMPGAGGDGDGGGDRGRKKMKKREEKGCAVGGNGV